MKRKDKILISLFLIIGLFVAGTTVLVFYENSKNISGNFEISIEGINVSNLEIDNQIQKGNINFMTLPKNSSNILEAEWTFNYKGFNDPNNFIIIAYEEQQSILKITCSLNQPDDITNLELNITFNQNYNNYSFTSDSGNANIKFNSHALNYSIFEIETSSGNIDVKLNISSIYNDFKIATVSGTIDLFLDDLICSKDFICTSDSGDQFIDIWNIGFLSYSNFNFSALSGRIIVKWANHYNKSHNVNLNLKSHNDVSIKMWAPMEIAKFDLFYEAINGTSRFHRVISLFKEISVNHYHSFNFNTSGVDLYNISAITTYGHASVFLVDCFKWQRKCNWARDFSPYNVHTSGEYIVPKKDHTATTIEFYNLNYVYLNRTEFLDINFELLPISSENLIHLVWDLTYKHAMGIGVGLIKVAISNETEGNIFKMYFDIDYEIDRILPTFPKYNITAFIHPSYVFNNYTK